MKYLKVILFISVCLQAQTNPDGYIGGWSFHLKVGQDVSTYKTSVFDSFFGYDTNLKDANYKTIIPDFNLIVKKPMNENLTLGLYFLASSGYITTDPLNNGFIYSAGRKSTINNLRYGLTIDYYIK